MQSREMMEGAQEIMGVTLGISHSAACPGPREEVPQGFWRILPVMPPPAAIPGSPGEVDSLLSELPGAVHGVLVGLVLHHLHALALLALLVAVLADGVELPHAVLPAQSPPSVPPAPVAPPGG